MDIIEQAIRDKKLISFKYNGHSRLAEPHVLGDKDGVRQVLCYQIGGTSSKGVVPDWRRFDVHSTYNLTVEAQSFPGARPQPGRHSSWDRVIIIVAP